MPIVNKYIIQDIKNKKYYREATDEKDNWGGINEAWVFGGERLVNQTYVLVRNSQKYEIILKINKDGSLRKIR